MTCLLGTLVGVDEVGGSVVGRPCRTSSFIRAKYFMHRTKEVYKSRYLPSLPALLARGDVVLALGRRATFLPLFFQTAVGGTELPLATEKLERDASSSASSSSSSQLLLLEEDDEEDEKSPSSTWALQGPRRQRTHPSSCRPAKVLCHSLLSGMVKTLRISGGSKKVNTCAIKSDPSVRIGGLLLLL